MTTDNPDRLEQLAAELHRQMSGRLPQLLAELDRGLLPMARAAVRCGAVTEAAIDFGPILRAAAETAARASAGWQELAPLEPVDADERMAAVCGLSASALFGAFVVALLAPWPPQFVGALITTPHGAVAVVQPAQHGGGVSKIQ